jgi:hypothetical protein
MTTVFADAGKVASFIIARGSMGFNESVVDADLTLWNAALALAAGKQILVVS